MLLHFLWNWYGIQNISECHFEAWHVRHQNSSNKFTEICCHDFIILWGRKNGVLNTSFGGTGVFLSGVSSDKWSMLNPVFHSIHVHIVQRLCLLLSSHACSVEPHSHQYCQWPGLPKLYTCCCFGIQNILVYIHHWGQTNHGLMGWMKQWRSYTRAYQGTGPCRICLCPGKMSQ